MKRILGILLVASTLLSGCAAKKLVPDDFTGPTAMVSDSGSQESGTKGRLFVLSEVDGEWIQSSIGATRSASEGRGFALTLRFVERRTPIRPMKVKLWGTHITGAPIHAIFSQLSGDFQSVEGVVDFTPVEGGSYLVNGELLPTGSSVWIEDRKTGVPVTEKIRTKPEPKDAK